MPCTQLERRSSPFTGIARLERAIKVADGLLRPQFFSGWGIRTIANTEARYNPMSYHNGSIWPHDNALITLGLARYGLKRSVERVFKGLFDAATYMDMRRLPELFCGFPRGRGRGPTHYPVACSPQAWASATPFTLIEASLGLQFDPDATEIRLLDPRLPSFLDEVVLRNLQLKQSSVDLKVRRHASEVSVEILDRRGQIQVSVVFGRTPESRRTRSRFTGQKMTCILGWWLQPAINKEGRSRPRFRPRPA